jgi:hypothetical protein
VIELYKQGKTRGQIAEAVHMSFKDISDIINEYIGEAKQVNKPEKSNIPFCSLWTLHIVFGISVSLHFRVTLKTFPAYWTLELKKSKCM